MMLLFLLLFCAVNAWEHVPGLPPLAQRLFNVKPNAHEDMWQFFYEYPPEYLHQCQAENQRIHWEPPLRPVPRNQDDVNRLDFLHFEAMSQYARDYPSVHSSHNIRQPNLRNLPSWTGQINMGYRRTKKEMKERCEARHARHRVVVDPEIVFAELLDMAQEQQVELWPMFGSLLWMYRSHKIKKADDDFDVSVSFFGLVWLSCVAEPYLFERYGWTMRVFVNSYFSQLFDVCNYKTVFGQYKIQSNGGGKAIDVYSHFTVLEDEYEFIPWWPSALIPTHWLYPLKPWKWTSNVDSRERSAMIPQYTGLLMECVYGKTYMTPSSNKNHARRVCSDDPIVKKWSLSSALTFAEHAFCQLNMHCLYDRTL